MKEKSRKTIIITGLFLFFLIVTVSSVYAVEGSVWEVIAGGPTKDWYKKNAEILVNNSIGRSVLRDLSWGVTRILVYLAEASNTVYDKVFILIKWTTDSSVNSFVNSFKPIFVALFALSLMVLGITLILKHDKKPNVMINIIYAILFVTCSTAFFTMLNNWTIELKKDIDGYGISGGKEFRAAYDTVNSNLIDLVAVDKRLNGLENMDYKASPGKTKGGCGIEDKESFSRTDYTEVLNYKSTRHNLSETAKELLSYQLISDLSGDQLVPISNGFGWNSGEDADIGNNFYYRYHQDTLCTWFELFALCIIYITMSYKVVRVIFELFIGRLLGYLYSAEISGGEKIKKIFVFIRDSYILLIVTAICVKVYVLLNASLSKLDVDGLAKGLICLFIAFSVIDGPNLVEKLLGMDAGLKSSTARWLAIGRAATGIGRIVSPRNIAQEAQNIKSGDMAKGGLAAGAVGTVFGKEKADGSRRGGITGEGGLAERLNSAGTKNNSGGTNVIDRATPASQTGPAGASGVDGSSGANAGKGAKGDPGEKGDPGRDGKDGREFMNQSSHMNTDTGSSRGVDHSFMNSSGNTGARSSRGSSGSSMPKRTVNSTSRFSEKKNNGGGEK